MIVREGGGRTAVQGDGSLPDVVDDLGQLLRGQILEVGFPVSTGIDADDLHQAYSFMMTVFLGRGSTPCVGRGRMVGSAGRHTDLERPLALAGAAVSHGVLPAMAWEGPGSRPRGMAPRATDATVPLWRKNASAEGRDAWEGRAVAARWCMASRHGAAWQVAYEGTWGPRARGLRGTGRTERARTLR